MTAYCGRPKVNGKPCKNTRPILHMYLRGQMVAAACTFHMTDSEYMDFAHEGALEEEGWRDRHQQRPVACHGWLITDEHSMRANAARAAANPEVRYDLSWDLLADWQDGRCAVCGDTHDASRLDHDHETGLVRGWLCHSCNIKEGYARMPGCQFERYRQLNPASILGIEIRYYSRFSGWAQPAG